MSHFILYYLNTSTSMTLETRTINIDIESGKDDKNRSVWIDIAKGIAIILVILGNMEGLPFSVRKVIYSFHIPLFMIINGYLIQGYDVKNVFIKSCKSLLKPYIIVCFLASIIGRLMAPDVGAAGQVFFSKLNALVVGMSKVSTKFLMYETVGLIWFVVCLFLSRNIYVILRVWLKKTSIILQNAIIIFLSFVGYYIGTKYAFLPWSLDIALLTLVFWAVGDAIRNHKLQLKLNVIIVLTSFVVWFFLLYHGVYVELEVRYSPNFILGIICAIAGSISVMGISVVIVKFKFIARILSWFGRYSMLILGIHSLEMMFFKWELWIYQPLGLISNWMLDFACHFVFITVFATLLLWMKKLVYKIDMHLKHSENFGNLKRLDWPDVAKGICIISVILGHLGANFRNQFVYTYHLPVFFLLAGYFMKKKSDEECVREKTKRLLIPYIFTCIVICIISLIEIIAGDGGMYKLFSWIGAALYGAGDTWTVPFYVKGIGAIWFLWALFFAMIIVNHFIDVKYGGIIILCIAFMGWSSFDKTQVWLPLSIQAGMFAALYVYIGFIVHEHDFISKGIGAIPFAGVVLIWIWSIQNYKGFWLVHNFMGNGWLDFLTSLCASYVIIVISKYISEKTEIVKRMLVFYGKNSLAILCFHLIELNVIQLQFSSRFYAEQLSLNQNQEELVLIGLKIIFVTFMVIIANRIPVIKKVFQK